MDCELDVLLSNLDINSLPSILDAPYKQISMKNNELFLTMVENMTFLTHNDILFILTAFDNSYNTYDIIFLGLILENIDNTRNTYSDILHISLSITSKFRETTNISTEIMSLLKLLNNSTELCHSTKIYIDNIIKQVYDILIYVSLNHTDIPYSGELYFTKLYNAYVG